MTKAIVTVCSGPLPRTKWPAAQPQQANLILAPRVRGGEVAIPIIGNMKISPKYIEWSGSRSSPLCRATYKTRAPRGNNAEVSG